MYSPGMNELNPVMPLSGYMPENAARFGGVEKIDRII